MTQTDYDVIIIGAGISGLVCGCYLAKAGLKTLIVDKNQKPGGYCTSFKSKRFRFDAFVHSLGSCRKDGNISKVLKELNLDNKFTLNRCDPSDTIFTPEHKISFWSDANRTIQEFQKNFPKEANNIKNFFNDLVNYNGASSLTLRNKTFENVLDRYFKNKHLKAILSLPVLGNAGLPPSLISAFFALKLYREFMIDGGYYLKDGMQVLSDTIAQRFKEFGGDLILATVVAKIKVKNNRAEGVILKNYDFISSKYLVSNIDAMQTFFYLLGESVVGREFLNMLSKREPSLSMFILYLGIDEDLEGLPKDGSNTWYLPYYDVEDMYLSAKNRRTDNLAEFMVHVFSKTSLSVFINAQFENKDYWNSCKDKMLEELIKRLENIIPNLPRHIIYQQVATPYTLYQATLNYKGAAYGWAALPSQLAEPGLAQTTCVDNLYLTGHWTTLTQGASGVAYLGRDTANLILRKESKI